LKQQVLTILKENNQEHIIKILDKMTVENQDKLMKQILDLDFKEVNNLYDELKNGYVEKLNTIEPIKYIEKVRLSDEARQEFEELGVQVIKDNKLAVLTVAGGQGTRLGHQGPKGTYELELEEVFGKKVSIFEVLANNFIKAKSVYNVDINWYLMLSNENKYDTVKFFVDNNYFGLPKECVKFFMQNDVPLIDENGKVVIGKDFLIKTASNGNGGVYEVLESEVLQAEDLEASDEFSFRKSKNGKENRPLFQDFQESRPIFQQDFQEVLGVNNTVLDDMKNRNIEWIFVSGVDNILVNPIDPLFIGLTIKEGNLIASKTVKKTDANEKTGVFAKKNGKIGVIEYNEISEELRNAKDDDGELVYGQSNIVSHLYNIEALEVLKDVKLRYHKAHKKNAYVNEDLELVVPEEPNTFKFEKFIFDAYEKFEGMSILSVKKDEEFAPIKNAEGKDSPVTAIELYLKAKK